MPRSQVPRILIVDDEIAQMQALCNTLRDHGYETAGFTAAREALAALRRTKFDLLLADLMMPEMNGIELLLEAQRADHDLVGIIMTGEGTITSAVEAMKTGALDYIQKPFKLSIILPVLARALAVRDLRMANAELERNVRERTSELEAANKELEAFAYSVSHDLRSPLTVILSSADLLMGDELRPASQQLLRNIATSADRMTQLISDLLRLSRLGRQPLSKSPVDMSALVREVLDEILKHPGQRHIDVHIAELSTGFGDPALLKQVFANLISNAFKFTRGIDHPRVEIVCLQQDGENVYCVRDNGAGFDMRHAKDLFRPFQRLHSDQKFEGTGVGLSIVDRIVQRHGGRVWVEAKPGQGAAFHFSLPRSI